MDKIMICFPDARIEKMAQSGLDMLKRLTGYDTLTVETKRLSTTNTLVGQFPILITSQSDLTWVQDPGIIRRLVYLHFNESIKESEVKPDLYSDLSKNMGWLIDMVINMTQERAK
jgi:phage/plasmid-associated DNA primase